VKGLCRGLHPAGIFALAHATSTRGADHLRARSWALRKDDSPVFMNLPEARALFDSMDANPGKNMIIAERAATLADAAGRCKGAVTSWACAAPLSWRYPLFGGLAKLLTAATGVDFSEHTISEAADRIYTLEMAFNTRQGLTRREDRLPERPELRRTGEALKEQEKHARMLAEYYRAHGCDPATGCPTSETLTRLGLDFAAKEIAANGPYPAWQGPPYRRLDDYPHGGVRA
jgi:aldehyde:ferredoxin oxidoreductase